MRTFHMIRTEDVSGVSGIGNVADGIEFHDGSVAIRWRGAYRSTVVWDCLAGAVFIHGHDGKTEFRPGIITCPNCRMTSASPDDFREGYCGKCHEHTSIPWSG